MCSNLSGVLLEAVPKRLGPSILGPFAALVYTEEFTLTDNDVQVGFLLKKNHPDPLMIADNLELTDHVLPAVPYMATAVQVGGADLVFQALGHIAHWIEDNGYRMAGPYREIVLDASTVEGMADAVIEIHMPVEKKSQYGK